jgi:hypothetical protein
VKNITLALASTILFGFLGLNRASAQLGPPPAPMVPSAGMVPSANRANSPTPTKVIKIYNGAGSFDDALAEKLRPTLAKTFPSSVPESPKAAPGGTAVPTKTESQKKLAEATLR